LTKKRKGVTEGNDILNKALKVLTKKRKGVAEGNDIPSIDKAIISRHNIYFAALRYQLQNCKNVI